MADKKLRIPARKLKTETHKQLKIRTDMNSDAPYESVCNHLNKYTNLNDAHYIRYTSLYEICTKNVFLICLKKLFYFSMEAYIVHLAKGIRIFGQGYALKPK
jgi:hypothetical protein